jgi:anti-sigma regulatory factor (Ser/Thr protein kinase)
MAAARARREISDWLAPLGCPQDVEQDLLLVVSELVTNAVVHAGSAPLLIASHDDGLLRIEVFDDDASPPVLRRAGAADGIGGLGLQLVEKVAHRWGWEPTEDGKRVWAHQLCRER